jgi:hypothetical protein
MRWDYSISPPIDTLMAGEPMVPFKIVKSLYDDSDTFLMSVDTTAADAHENAEPGFLDEYLNYCKTYYSFYLDYILDYNSANLSKSTPPSWGNTYGLYLKNSLVNINTILKGVNTTND